MTDESFSGSVSIMISGLKEGESRAAQDLWNRYFPQLIRLASRRLGNASRRIADEEDLAIDVFECLCEGARNGRFEQLNKRDDLWKLLVAITGMKAVDQIRRQTAKKRGAGDVRGNSIFIEAGDMAGGFEQFAANALSPEFICEMNEQQLRLMKMLPDDKFRQIATLRLEGMSHEEIAKEVGISLRSVARKFDMIRLLWEDELS